MNPTTVATIGFNVLMPGLLGWFGLRCLRAPRAPEKTDDEFDHLINRSDRFRFPQFRLITLLLFVAIASTFVAIDRLTGWLFSSMLLLLACIGLSCALPLSWVGLIILMIATGYQENRRTLGIMLVLTSCIWYLALLAAIVHWMLF